MMYWGVENKMTYGRGGGSCILSGNGGSDVFHWSFFSLKVIAQIPLISQLYNVRLSEPLGDIENKICPILVKQ